MWLGMLLNCYNYSNCIYSNCYNSDGKYGGI